MLNKKVSTFKDRLNEAMEIRRKRAVDLSKETGITESQLSNYRRGRYDAKQNSVYALARSLDVAEAWLMGFDVPMERGFSSGSNYHQATFEVPQFHKLPVYGMVSAGLGEFADNHIVDYEEASINYNRDDYFYLIVDGDSMEPQIHDGQLALVQKTPTVDSGSVAIVTIDGEEGVIKKVIYDETTVTLISFNDKYPPRVFKDEEKLRLRVQGKVLKTISRW